MNLIVPQYRESGITVSSWVDKLDDILEEDPDLEFKNFSPVA